MDSIKKILSDWQRNRLFARKVSSLRNAITVGSRVSLLRPNEAMVQHQQLNGVVLNVRNYYHGQPEVYFLADNHQCMLWVTLDMIMPEIA